MKKLIIFLLALAAMFFVFSFILFGGNLLEKLSASSPIVTVLIATGSLIVTSFLFGMVTDDYSWVDRMWSTAPVFFAWVYAAHGWFDVKLFIAAVLVTLWGARLTFNFARKGGYTGMEDYRWPVLRKKITNPVLWQLFNFGFISTFQISMFVLFTLPLYRIYLNPGVPPSAGFYITAFFFLFFLVWETVADQQQWNFHNIKKSVKNGNLSSDLNERQKAYARDAEEGFLQSGLFRVSRHPNYFGELAIWWTFFIMGSLHAGTFLHWSLAGPVLLTILFFGSTRFTEAISSEKYPAYSEFQNSVSAVIPWFPARRSEQGEMAERPAK